MVSTNVQEGKTVVESLLFSSQKGTLGLPQLRYLAREVHYAANRMQDCACTAHGGVRKHSGPGAFWHRHQESQAGDHVTGQQLLGAGIETGDSAKGSSIIVEKLAPDSPSVALAYSYSP
jgi:hypothetical protein